MHRIIVIAKNKNFPKRIGDRPPFIIHAAIEQRMEASAHRSNPNSANQSGRCPQYSVRTYR